MHPVDSFIKKQLDDHVKNIGKQLGKADVISIFSPIVPGIDTIVRNAIEMNSAREDTVAIILQTPGGVVEVVERIVGVIRYFYKEVIVVVPDQAMSAGTVLALSADKIMMDYFSRLGPIDPQIFKDGNLVPALSYLKQYEKLNKKAEEGNLTTAEYAMLNKLDLGELYQFEQARELSVELLEKWLSQYKFKDWKTTETHKTKVTENMKQERAKKIAQLLNEPERWHSHGRGIDIATLSNELNLKIQDYSENQTLSSSIRAYFSMFVDYLDRQKSLSSIHTKEYFDYV